MESDILDEIKRELGLIANADYRRRQGIHAGEKQLKLLNRLFARITSDNKNSIDDFCRVVSDMASGQSTIFLLAEKLCERCDRNAQ